MSARLLLLNEVTLDGKVRPYLVHVDRIVEAIDVPIVDESGVRTILRVLRAATAPASTVFVKETVEGIFVMQFQSG